MPPTPVETSVVRAQSMSDRFRTVGSVEAAEFVRVTAEIDALVTALPFVEGDAVRAGSVLVRLDDVQLRAEASRATALLEQARSSLERTETLVREGILTAQARDDVRANVRVAEANVALARARLSKTVVSAPWSGVLGRRLASPGAFVRAGDVLAELVRLDDVKILFSVPERHLADLAKGALVLVSSPAWPGVVTEAHVTLVDPIVDPGTRGVRLIARAPNPQHRLLPGMSADIDVPLAERSGALVVPAEAVFVEGNQSLVYVVKDDGTVTRTPVELGARTAGEVEVVSGLAEGTRVVRAGHQKLYEGAKVQPVDSSAPPAASATTPAGEAAGR